MYCILVFLILKNKLRTKLYLQIEKSIRSSEVGEEVVQLVYVLEIERTSLSRA